MAKVAEADVDKTQQSQETQDAAQKQAQQVEFAEVPEGEVTAAAASLDILLDLEVPITVAIGQTQIPIGRLLQLAPGSVLRLDKPIDEPAELYLRGIKFATGTIVVVDGCFAVKIKEILKDHSPSKTATQT